LAAAIAFAAPAAAQGPLFVPPTPESGAASAPSSATPAPEAARAGPRVSEVVISGTQRIDPETVRSYMTLRPGDVMDSDAVNASLKKLFATGLFTDVTITVEGTALVVRVVENPIINQVAFEGNKELKDEDLRNEIQLRPRVVFTRTRVQSDVKRILELYRRSGRFAATVDPKVIQLDQNRVDLVYEIKEGPVTGVRRIGFVGNRFFSDGALREVLLTKESRWYRFLSSSDNYDPDRLTFDRELLRRYYLEHGFADFRVVSAVAELTPDQEDFFITFTLDEGERYRIGAVDLTSQIPEIDPNTLHDIIKIDAGDWYNANKIDNTVLALTDAAGDRGYAFVEVRPVTRRDRDKRTIDITFEIGEGPRVFVERIDIRGNVRTHDEIIRREFRLVEGDAFNAARLRRSQQRIQNLGYFSKAEVNNIPGSTPDRTIIQADVEEQSTGELSFGAGYSTSEGVLGEVGIRERNLLGRGQDLTANFTLSQRSQRWNLGFVEPYFLDKELRAGVNLFRTQRDNSDESGFSSVRTGSRFSLGYEINEEWSQSVSYTIRKDEMKDIDADASQFIKAQKGSSTTSMVGQSLTYDARNSAIDPTEGFISRASTDFAGLGGSVRYMRLGLKSAYYYPFASRWVGMVSGEVGKMFGLGQDIRVDDRFFAGGETMRGFETAGIGPRDRNTQDALGGTVMALATVELGFPVFLPEELGFSGAVFSDVGIVTQTPEESPLIADESSPRVAAGVGLKWKSPFGPVRLDLSHAIVKESFDKTQLLHFRFGTRF